MSTTDRPRFGRIVQAGPSYQGKQRTGLRAWPHEGHVHERHESAFCLVGGADVELWTGDELQEKAVASEGDYLYIPPGVPHVAVNRNVTRPARFIGARTDPNEQEGVVMRPELDGRVP